jgi:hypothetical protein
MTTTNHTSPSGEDAANGAIGERGRDVDIADFLELIDAYQCAQKDGTHDERAQARIALMNAYRDALTAGKVAAEPISDDHAATLWRLARMTDAAAWTAEFRKAVAPQQPAQSAEQDDLREDLEACRNLILTLTRRIHDLESPQPAQTQVALSRAEIARIAGSCMESGRYAMFMAYIDAALAKETNNG